jgi:hypothetical protein
MKYEIFSAEMNHKYIYWIRADKCLYVNNYKHGERLKLGVIFDKSNLKLKSMHINKYWILHNCCLL